MTSYFILCHGHQTRLNGHIDYPKQLIELYEGRTILKRTVDLLRWHDSSSKIFLVAPSIEPWLEQAKTLSFDQHIPFEEDIGSKGTLATVLALSPKWSNTRTVMLLGDVIWKRSTLASLVNDPSPHLTRWNRESFNPLTDKGHGESFAVSWGARHNLVFKSWLESKLESNPQAKLSDLIYVSLDKCLDSSDDFTDDIDTVRDFTVVLPNIQECIRLENLRITRGY